MVAMPEEARWLLESLRPSDEGRVHAFLEREPLLNVYLIGRLRNEGIRPESVAAATLGSELRCVGLIGVNVVVSAMPGSTADERDHAMSLFADRVVERAIQVRAMISDADLVDRLWRRIAHASTPPTVIRHAQPVYALTAGARQLPDLELVRNATQLDFHTLVQACARMHREEVGIDPLQRDPVGYRDRVRDLIERQRAFVLVRGGEIVFKAEIAALTDRAAQIMGVWTADAHRGHGWARRGLAEICGHLLRRGRAVTLFVNDFNKPAIRLYESLGFQRIGTNRSLIW